jgi:hypothetical protein
MTIYQDTISESLGLRPITDFFPDYDFNYKPEDASLKMNGSLNPFWGLQHTNQTKDRLRKAWDNDPERKEKLSRMSKDPEVCKKRSESVKAWYDSASEKEIKTKTKAGLDKMNSHIECPHCGIKTNRGNIGRYHGDKCKKKSIDIIPESV